MANEHYAIIAKKEEKKPLNFPEPQIRADQYDQPIGPHRETTVERIKRHATTVGRGVKYVGQEVDYARKEVGKFIEKPEIKGTIKHLKERGEDISRGQRLAPRPQKQSTPKQSKVKQTKPVGKMQPARRPQSTYHPPPAYVVQNGKTLAAQLDPFGVQSGVIDNYQRLTAPRPPFGKSKQPPGTGNPFGI